MFEAHSTDNQPEEALTSMVPDGFAILKAGSGLTFAYREALNALDMIGPELVPSYESQPLATAMEKLTLDHPGDWHGHYRGGDEASLRLQRHCSYSDRIRYYWNRPEAVRMPQSGEYPNRSFGI